MKLMETNIPLDVLEAEARQYFDLGNREGNALENAGIELVWHLLLFTEGNLKFRNFSKVSRDATVEKIRARGLEPGALQAYAAQWTRAIVPDERRKDRVFLFTAASTAAWGQFHRANAARLKEFCAGHHVRQNMRIEELFVSTSENRSSPTERPPLTPEQIAFLRRRIVNDLTSDVDEVDCAVRMRYQFVYELALVIGSTDRSSHTPPSVGRLRAKIEEVLGPLPLTMTWEEFVAIRQ